MLLDWTELCYESILLRARLSRYMYFNVQVSLLSTYHEQILLGATEILLSLGLA